MLQKQNFKPEIVRVRSKSNSDKTYLVAHYRPHRWQCTCPDYIYRSHDEKGYSTGHKCKHIKEIKKEIGDL